MSCGNPTTATDALMPRKPKLDKTKECVRCKEAKGSIVIRHAVYCKECFFPLILHKFRRSLEPCINPKPEGPRRTALKPSGNLLIGYSGGLGSTVLLDMIHRCYIASDQSNKPEGGRNHPRHERVWKTISVCYIETCDAIPGSKDRVEDIRKAVRQYDGVEFIVLRIQDAFDLEWWESVGGKPKSDRLGVDLSNEELLLTLLSNSSPSSPLVSLQSYLTSLPTPTAFPSTLHTLTRLLLLHTAVKTASSHLLLGTSLTSLAVALISGVAQGGGFHVKEEVREDWIPPPSIISSPVMNHEKRNEREQLGVRVVRPLRDIGIKECAAWAWWKGLNVVGRDKWRWPGSKPGIGALTKDFIVGLEKDYPSTVSTIVRTCAKLAPKGEVAGRCVLCQRPAQSGIQEWKTSIAIRSQTDLLGTTRTDPVAPSISLTPLLCYTCHTTLTSKSSRVAPPLYPSQARSTTPILPVWVSPGVMGDGFGLERELRDRKMDSDEMKSIVAQFLLQ